VEVLAGLPFAQSREGAEPFDTGTRPGVVLIHVVGDGDEEDLPGGGGRAIQDAAGPVLGFHGFTLKARIRTIPSGATTNTYSR